MKTSLNSWIIVIILVLIISSLNCEIIEKNFGPNIEKGLIFHLPIDGDAYDSANPDHSTIVKGASLVEDRNGKEKSAFFFDGIDDYIDIVNPITNPNDSTSFTISFWMKNLTLNSIPSFPLSLRGNTIIDLAFNVENLIFQIYFNNGYYSDEWKSAKTEVTPNEWVFIVARYNYRSEVEILVNNETKGRTPITLGDILSDKNNGSAIGCYNEANNRKGFWKGVIDDVRIYNRSLSKKEVDLLFKL